MIYGFSICEGEELKLLELTEDWERSYYGPDENIKIHRAPHDSGRRTDIDDNQLFLGTVCHNSFGIFTGLFKKRIDFLDLQIANFFKTNL